uniref:WRKY domain-containing protein n=2 Tax=Cannabis sativa TaxID=3483 RepID=A0A803R9S4_CANSA
MENKSIIVATYEGEHNHELYDDDQYRIKNNNNNTMMMMMRNYSTNTTSTTSLSPRLNNNNSSSSCVTTTPHQHHHSIISLDLSLSNITNDNQDDDDQSDYNKMNMMNREDGNIDTYLSNNKELFPAEMEEYVASLTKDQNFTVALAAAVARSITGDPDYI